MRVSTKRPPRRNFTTNTDKFPHLDTIPVHGRGSQCDVQGETALGNPNPTARSRTAVPRPPPRRGWCSYAGCRRPDSLVGVGGMIRMGWSVHAGRRWRCWCLEWCVGVGGDGEVQQVISAGGRIVRRRRGDRNRLRMGDVNIGLACCVWLGDGGCGGCGDGRVSRVDMS